MVSTASTYTFVLEMSFFAKKFMSVFHIFPTALGSLFAKKSLNILYLLH